MLEQEDRKKQGDLPEFLRFGWVSHLRREEPPKRRDATKFIYETQGI